MSAPVRCPRCGHLDSFITGYLTDTCVCRVCQSQLDWREIPGLGPDCGRLDADLSAGDDAEAVPAGAATGAAAPNVGPRADLPKPDVPGGSTDSHDPDLSNPDAPLQES